MVWFGRCTFQFRSTSTVDNSYGLWSYRGIRERANTGLLYHVRLPSLRSWRENTRILLRIAGISCTLSLSSVTRWS